MFFVIYILEFCCIVFIMFDGVKMFDIMGFLQVFVDVNEILGFEVYMMMLVLFYGGLVEIDIGVVLNICCLVGVGLDDVGMLIVCGGKGVYDVCCDNCLVGVICLVVQKCGCVVVICIGVFLLGVVDLFDG